MSVPQSKASWEREPVELVREYLEAHEDQRWNTGGWGNPPSMGPGLTGMQYGAAGVWGEITAPARLGGGRDTYFWTWTALDAGMDLSRTARLRIIGNGVVPQCVELGFRTLWGRLVDGVD